MNDDKTTEELHSLALKPSVFAEAPPIERATLKFVAAAIEIERQRLRPELGRVNLRQAQGFIASSKADVDVVDTMSWEDLLQWPGVIDRCKPDAETTPSKILRLVLEHCQPANRRALFWMRAFYSLSEQVHADQLNMALRLVKEHRAYMGKKRVEASLDARRAIGQATRAKVKALAEPMIGSYSRNQAALKIAQDVGLSNSTVSNLLIELFPGGYESWPRPSRSSKS